MALKFLNKKGWHTGSLHNIERVWKAEQKHNEEQAKLEELRKQIYEEREKAEFRQLQEQAGLVPRQERLDFLYESGLGVGKTSDGFKALETPAPAAAAPTSAEASSSKAAAPGALFEEKPQSANDTWRKLHSDPLLLIRQREQEALARIKNNPIQMSMIRKSVEAEKKSSKKNKGHREKKKHKKRHHQTSRSEKNSDSENTSGSELDGRKRNHSTFDTQKHSKWKHSSKDNSEEEEERNYRRKNGLTTFEQYKDSSSKHEKHSSRIRSDSRYPRESEEDRKMSSQSTKDRSWVSERDDDRMRRNDRQDRRSRVSERDEDSRERNCQQEYTHRVTDRDVNRMKRDNQEHRSRVSERDESRTKPNNQQGYNHKKGVLKMTEAEREARLREMQMDAELHEEQRWKRIKQSAEADAQEAARASNYKGKNFLDDAQKSIYGAEKGGSSTIEESVRRRAYYSQGGTDAHESNAFRR